MSQPASSSPKRLVGPLLLAAVLGGGVAAGVTAAVEGSSGSTHTTTVIRQPALAASGANRETVSSTLTAADIYKRYAPGVAYVKSDIVSQGSASPFDPFSMGPQRSVATGSGFVIDRNGDILTNNHVIDGATKVTVAFANKKELKATVVGKDPSTDLALLRVDPKGLNLTPLPLGSSKEVTVGDPTVAIGNPFGLDRTLTTGVVSALQREITAPNGFKITNVIQTDAAINPGNSGGPLIDAAGRVIGINSQIETGGSGDGNVGIGFAVPIDTAKSVLKNLKAGETVKRAYLGVTTVTVDSSLAALDLPTDHGALVQSIEPGGPADKAGLRAGDIQAQLQGGSGGSIVLGGDIITKFDGKDVRSNDDLSRLVDGHKPGDKVQVQILRDKQQKTVTVTLANRPSNLSAAG